MATKPSPPPPRSYDPWIAALRSRRRRRFRLNPPRSRFAAPHDRVGSISGRTIPALRIWRWVCAREVTGIEPLRTLGLRAAMADFGSGGMAALGD